MRSIVIHGPVVSLVHVIVNEPNLLEPPWHVNSSDVSGVCQCSWLSDRLSTGTGMLSISFQMFSALRVYQTTSTTWLCELVVWRWPKPKIFGELDENYPARPEVPLLEWSNRRGSESSARETDVYIWCYALLVVLAAQEAEEEEEIRSWIVRAVSVCVVRYSSSGSITLRKWITWWKRRSGSTSNGPYRNWCEPLTGMASQVQVHSSKFKSSSRTIRLTYYVICTFDYHWFCHSVQTLCFRSVCFCFVLCDTVVWCVKAVLRVSVVWMWYSVCNIHNTALLSILAQIIIFRYLLL